MTEPTAYFHNRVEFWYNNCRLAYWEANIVAVPRWGDLFRINDTLYLVDRVIWNHDNRVEIRLVEHQT